MGGTLHCQLPFASFHFRTFQLLPRKKGGTAKPMPSAHLGPAAFRLFPSQSPPQQPFCLVTTGATVRNCCVRAGVWISFLPTTLPRALRGSVCRQSLCCPSLYVQHIKNCHAEYRAVVLPSGQPASGAESSSHHPLIARWGFPAGHKRKTVSPPCRTQGKNAAGQRRSSFVAAVRWVTSPAISQEQRESPRNPKSCPVLAQQGCIGTVHLALTGH